MSESLVNLTRKSEIIILRQTSIKISQTKSILMIIIIMDKSTFIHKALNHIQGPEVEVIVCSGDTVNAAVSFICF